MKKTSDSGRGILSSGQMVRAILDGRKTQTRRVMKPQPVWNASGFCAEWKRRMVLPEGTYCSPYGYPGERLWVGEAWKTCRPYDPFSPSQIDSGAAVLWLADGAKRLNGPEDFGRYRHARFMPRWASRLTLEVTRVRVERLQGISERDAKAEGVAMYDGVNYKNYLATNGKLDCFATARESFETLWTSINGPGSWEKNPWVWVVEFKVVQNKQQV